MPLLSSPFTSPRRKSLSQRHPPTNTKSKKFRPPPPRHNYDEELRKYIASMSEQVPDVGHVASSEILGSSPSMPFSKDFGSFDLTICQIRGQTDDTKCVVLVKYEKRVFLNGKQIYLQQDGRVCDSHGNYDPVRQQYYELALQTRRRIRRNETTAEEDQPDNEQSHLPVSIGERGALRREQRQVGLDTGSEGIPCEHERETLSANYQSVSEMLDSRISVEEELKDLENNFDQFITRMAKVIHVVSEQEATDDTESAHSEGDAHYSEQRQLLQETLRRITDQYLSEVSDHLEIQFTCGQVCNDDEYGNDESTDMQSVSSTASVCDGLVASASSTDFTGHGLSVADNQESAWIHDCKSFKNEKVRLHAELAATRSELRRLQRCNEDMSAQYERKESDRAEMQELLREYVAENSRLKERFVQLPDDFILEEKRERRNTDEIENIKTELLTCEDVDVDSPETDQEKVTTTSSDGTTEMDTADIQDKFNHQTNKNGSLRSEMKRLRHVADDMEEEMDRMSQDHVSVQMRAYKLERDRKDLREKLQITEVLLEEVKIEVTSLDKKCAELETHCQKLEREKAVGQEENESTRKMLADIRCRYRILERDAGEMEKMVKLLEIDKQRQREDLDHFEQTQMENNNKSAKLLKDNGVLQVTLSQLKRDKSSLHAEMEILRLENEANNTAKREADESRQRALNELRELRGAHDEIAEKNLRLDDTVKSTESRYKVLKEQIEEWEQQTQDLNNHNKTLENRIRELSNTGRLLEVENSELKHSLRCLRSDSVELKTKIGELTKENADLRVKVRQLDHVNASSDEKSRNLLREMGDLKVFFRQIASLGSDAVCQSERVDSVCATLKNRKPHTLGTDEVFVDTSGLSSLNVDLRN